MSDHFNLSEIETYDIAFREYKLISLVVQKMLTSATPLGLASGSVDSDKFTIEVARENQPSNNKTPES